MKKILLVLLIALPVICVGQYTRPGFSNPGHYANTNIKMTNSIEREQVVRGDKQLVSYFKYEFEVFPGGNPTDVLAILLRKGKIVVKENGKLHFRGSDGKLYATSLYAMQYDGSGMIRDIPIQLKVNGAKLALDLGNYEMAEVLVVGIKPTR